ncbi:shisa family member 2a [Clupea harengus]|uniref:Shisa family member 2a n=1 Tax=Clupea harengus TaxID=7950 RepID=A0A6P3VLF7_CLUHA|nr:shisa family member 2a [Clupea harengus]
MSKSVLCALLVLLLDMSLPLCAEGAGEYCHGWSDSSNTWHRGFHCPEQYDGEDARYCCGTCTLRYCCTSVEARLDQSTCDPDDFINNSNGKVRTMTPNVPTYLPFVIVVSAFLSFVLVGTVVSVCCCHCLKPKSAEQHRGLMPTQTSLLEPGGAPPDSLTPSRDSNSSASSAGRSTGTTRPSGSDVTMNMYGPMGNMYPTLGLHQPQHFASPSHLPGPFYQPYLNYSVPPEHTMISASAFLENHSAYRHPHGQPFPQAPMHTEILCPGLTI